MLPSCNCNGFSCQKTSQGLALPRSYENQDFSAAVTDDNGVKVQWRLLDLLFLNVAWNKIAMKYSENVTFQNLWAAFTPDFKFEVCSKVGY